MVLSLINLTCTYQFFYVYLHMYRYPSSYLLLKLLLSLRCDQMWLKRGFSQARWMGQNIHNVHLLPLIYLSTIIVLNSRIVYCILGMILVQRFFLLKRIWPLKNILGSCTQVPNPKQHIHEMIKTAGYQWWWQSRKRVLEHNIVQRVGEGSETHFY